MLVADRFYHLKDSFMESAFKSREEAKGESLPANMISQLMHNAKTTFTQHSMLDFIMIELKMFEHIRKRLSSVMD
jgi:hypothetical protein